MPRMPPLTITPRKTATAAKSDRRRFRARLRSAMRSTVSTSRTVGAMGPTVNALLERSPRSGLTRTVPLLLVLTFAAAQRIAVLDVEASGVPKELADSVGLILPTEIRARAGAAQVTSGAEIRAM